MLTGPRNWMDSLEPFSNGKRIPDLVHGMLRVSAIFWTENLKERDHQ